MSIEAREVYCSENGDRWLLARDAGAQRVYVVHEANPASGGTKTDIELGAFLRQSRGGPEHQELVRLIGTLIDAP